MSWLRAATPIRRHRHNLSALPFSSRNVGLTETASGTQTEAPRKIQFILSNSSHPDTHRSHQDEPDPSGSSSAHFAVTKQGHSNQSRVHGRWTSSWFDSPATLQLLDLLTLASITHSANCCQLHTSLNAHPRSKCRPTPTFKPATHGKKSPPSIASNSPYPPPPFRKIHISPNGHTTQTLTTSTLPMRNPVPLFPHCLAIHLPNKSGLPSSIPFSMDSMQLALSNSHVPARCLFKI